ncbi:MAG: molybdopterin molybdenumtransferase MoeA [Planctomycetales bacterium]|nr:molybdopterin molybdenumtransferase MoeA [Planctomycetales bacterium]NIM08918.1 molybdopterin molybdenumtransferase MoeA [Planctomycetales bacterium]NIN08388.1 molybdopterin molybdenumtransferase MoeA [Planctomycetales bacterium]NIN77516.1 molybdopterin molybdenumtransferase MoeA [Planctomycetales bacterium]NIO34688.1 molybdopterin molybdenumtransferase MoeA [Planctomycetales bacterium]
MISAEQALQLVLDAAQPRPPARVSLAESLGRVLGEDVASDVDSPPHDKSLVDGYAVSAGAFGGRAENRLVELAVIAQIAAGEMPVGKVARSTAVRVMTGAPIPEGADAVVMVEQAEWQDDPAGPLGVVRFPQGIQVTAGQNIMRRGASLRRGQVVLDCGISILPAQIGLLAEVGRADVAVVPPPQVAVLPTGDELVDVGFVPGPGKIRNSNGPMLISLARQAGAVVRDLGVGRDDYPQLAALVHQGLHADILITAGGVSAGVRDLVPQVLRKAGVAQVFHKVRLKPGKPLWFGVRRAGVEDQGEAASTLVFGLPGNPVSSFVCFHLFVAPAIARLAGHPRPTAMRVMGRLSDPFQQGADRATYHPAWMEHGDPHAVRLIPWRGSADLRALVDANALAVFPAENRSYQPGDPVECLLLPAGQNSIWSDQAVRRTL